MPESRPKTRATNHTDSNPARAAWTTGASRPAGFSGSAGTSRPIHANGRSKSAESAPRWVTTLAESGAAAADPRAASGRGSAGSNPSSGPISVSAKLSAASAKCSATGRAGSSPGAVPNGAAGQPTSAAAMIQQLLTTPRQPPSSIASAFGSGNTGGIAGVASTAPGKGIHEVNDHSKYKEWEFVYDLKKDKTVVGAAGSGRATTDPAANATAGWAHYRKQPVRQQPVQLRHDAGVQHEHSSSRSSDDSSTPAVKPQREGPAVKVR